ncbi:MAG: ABC transporter ATP-binding protein [Spirochaetia bacterium]
MAVYQEEEYSKQFDLTVWKNIFSYTKPFRKLLLAMVFCMVTLAGIDAIFPFFSGWIIDNVITPGEIGRLPAFGIFYFSIVAFQGFVIWLFIFISGKVEMGVCYEIRKKGFQKIQELSFSYFDRTPVGWIMARMTSDSQRLGEMIAWGLIDLTWGSSLMVIMSIVMIAVNWKLALLTLSVMPVLVGIAIYFQRKILKRYREVRKINSKITGSFNEGIRGAVTSKTLVREEENHKDFKDLTGNMRYSSIRAAILSSLFLPAVLSLGAVGTALALWYGGNGVALGTISYGVLVSFIFASVQFFEPVMELSRVFAQIQYAQASAERVISLLNTEAEIIDDPRLISGEEAPEMVGNVEFKDVGFKYKNGEQVLTGFNLRVKAGEKIALVGETGSGKSTIVNLACRFYEPTEGSILIDGVDYRRRTLEWLHSNLGYVLQAPHLFSGTVHDNIRYGNLEASEDDITRAAELVNAHRFVEKLEKGYDTEVGEGGNLLSTGEKQLISFARAILSNPRLFVLDEATSSVDTETEQLIQNAIENVLEGRTSFIIAHRLSTIKNADRILVIQNGKIVEEGNHHDLIAAKRYYYKLYTNQFMEEEEEKLLHQ